MQENITTARGLLKCSYLSENNSQKIVTYFCSTFNIDTVNYQNCSHLYYRKIHLWRCIRFYFTFTYNYSLIFIMIYIKLSHNYDFLANIKSFLLWYF